MILDPLTQVEFMEELQAGEIQISDWDTPLSDARVDVSLGEDQALCPGVSNQSIE